MYSYISNSRLSNNMEAELRAMRELILAHNQHKLREFESTRPTTLLQIPPFQPAFTLSFPDSLSVLHPLFRRVGFSYLPTRGYIRLKENYGKFLELDSSSSNFNYLLSDCPVAEAEFVRKLGDPKFSLEDAMGYWRKISLNPLLGSVHYSEVEDALERAVVAKMHDILIYLKGVSFTILSIRSDEQISMGTVLSNFAQCYCRICHKYICSGHDLNDPIVSQQENRSQDCHFHKCLEPRCREMLLRFEPLLLKIQAQEVRTFRDISAPGNPAKAHELLMNFKLFDVFGYQICKLANYLYGCCEDVIIRLPPLTLNHQKADIERRTRKRFPKDHIDISVPLCSHDGPCTTCSCASKEICQKQCGCEWNCTLRYAGCACPFGCKIATEMGCPCKSVGKDCDPDLCTCRGCTNSRVIDYFKGRKLPKTAISISSIPSAGLGLFAREAILEGTFLGIYAGELCRIEEQDIVAGRSVPNYKWSFDENQVINAKCKGSKSRFMNHRDQDYNVDVQVVGALGTSFVVFTAARRITLGEELTINYGRESQRII